MALFSDPFREQAHRDNSEPATWHFAVDIILCDEDGNEDQRQGVAVDKDGSMLGDNDQATDALALATLSLIRMGCMPIQCLSTIKDPRDWSLVEEDGPFLALLFDYRGLMAIIEVSAQLL